MASVKRNLIFIYLFSKRLYKKVSFLIILLALVLVTVFMGFAMRQESSMLKIAVVKPQSFNGISDKVASTLFENSTALSYEFYSLKEAEKMLVNGKVDEVWIFGENLKEDLKGFVTGNGENAPINVLTKEKSVFTNLSMELIYAKLFPIVAEEIYFDYGQEELGAQNREQLKEYYDAIERNGKMVQLSYYNGDGSVEETNYLLTPLRGVLAVILLFCSMSAALYFLNDCECGNLDAIPLKKRWERQLVYTLTATLNAAIFVMLALKVSGLMGNFTTELISMLIYSVSCCGFATVISGIMRKAIRMAPTMVVLTLAAFAVCPIFLNSKIPLLPGFFPTNWYLKAVYNPSVLSECVLYCFIIYVLSFIIWRKQKYFK